MVLATQSVGAEGRVGTAIAVSLLLHAAGLGVFLNHVGRSAKGKEEVITDVELLLEARRQGRPVQVAKLQKAPSMKDFLKLALPAMPKVEPVRGPLEVKVPEAPKTLMDLPKPKLDDRGRLKAEAKLEALDLGKKRVDLAKVDQPLVDRQVRAPIAVAKLEEIGSRRAAPKVLEMAALSEERSRQAAPVLPSLSLGAESRKRPGAAAPLLPEEAAPRTPSASERLGGILSSGGPGLRLEPKEMPVKPLKTLAKVEPAALPPRKQEAGLRAEKKKAVEIEGPLSKRKILASSIPDFPDWAREQGLIEAEVTIRFYVAPGGQVMDEDMRVERTSGYGRLDRLAMEHLKRWRFEPLPLDGRKEWGNITFRFLLE